MPRVTFVRDFRFRISRFVVRSYQAGKTYLVQQREQQAALAVGAIVGDNGKAARSATATDGAPAVDRRRRKRKNKN